MFFYSIIAYGTMILGVTLMLTALALIVLAAFITSNFDGAEVVLIVSAFILLGTGAHFMDTIEKLNIARRRNFYKRLKIQY